MNPSGSTSLDRPVARAPKLEEDRAAWRQRSPGRVTLPGIPNGHIAVRDALPGGIQTGDADDTHLIGTGGGISQPQGSIECDILPPSQI